jgi:hypothetical protein
MACRNGRYFVVTGTFARFGQDEREGPPYDLVSDLVISPAGEHVVYAGERNGRQFIVVDERQTMTSHREGPPLDRVWQPAFSDDGRQVCYNTRDGSEAVQRCIEAPGIKH